MLSLHANSWQPVAEVSDPTILSYLHPSDRLTMHLTCEPCHRAKTACDGLQPCARCVRLQRTQMCVPHQRKRSRRSHPLKSNAATSSPSAAASALPASTLRSQQLQQQQQQLESARQQLATAFGTGVERSSALTHGSPEIGPLNYPTLHSAVDSSLFQRSLSYESVGALNANIDYPTGGSAAAQESMFSSGNSVQQPLPPATRIRNDSAAAFWEPSTPTDFLGILQQQQQQRAEAYATPKEKSTEPSAIPGAVLTTAQSHSMHPDPPTSQRSTSVPPAPPNSEVSSASSKNRKIQGWEERVLKGPEPLDPAAFEPLQAASFQTLLRRELESGRMSPYVLTYHLTSLSETLCFEDWKRLVLLMPIPVPPCSTRAGFSSSLEFRNWWIAQRMRCRALAKSQTANVRVSPGSSTTTPGSSRSSTTGSTAPKPVSAEATNSEDTLIAPHLLYMPMLFEVDYSDCPFLCVEDEQMLAGLMPRIVMLQHATVSQPLQLSIVTRSSKQRSSRADKSSRRRKKRSSRNKDRRSSSSSSDRSISRSRSRSRSRSHSFSSRSSSSSRSLSPSASRSRRHHRRSSRRYDEGDDRSRSDSRSHSRSRSRSRSRRKSSKSSSSRRSHDRSETDSFRRELQSRLKAFDSRKSASYFDTLRTKHSINCADGKAGQETEQYVTEALAAAAANERAIELSSDPDTGSQDRDSSSASDFSMIGLARCGCPCIAQRRMHVQVNRAFERVIGWSQKEVRGLLIQNGQIGMRELMGNNRDPDTELYASFVVLLCGHHDFCLPYFTPLRTRWGGSVQAQMGVKLIVSENELDGWICTWTVDPQQKSKGSSAAAGSEPSAVSASIRENIKSLIEP